MEKLREYLASRPKAQFAESVGIVPAYLSQILAGSRRPSAHLMFRIARASEGAVPVTAWDTEAAS